MTAQYETASTVRCSFCGKESTEVERVVAGAGVYICNECVHLCTLILEQESEAPSQPRMPAWESMTDEEILDHLPRVAAVEAQVQRSLHEWVLHVRERGVTWERIGMALNITRQSAWERFGGGTNTR